VPFPFAASLATSFERATAAPGRCEQGSNYRKDEPSSEDLFGKALHTRQTEREPVGLKVLR
jgi:hypothetical protein